MSKNRVRLSNETIVIAQQRAWAFTIFCVLFLSFWIPAGVRQLRSAGFYDDVGWVWFFWPLGILFSGWVLTLNLLGFERITTKDRTLVVYENAILFRKTRRFAVSDIKSIRIVSDLGTEGEEIGRRCVELKVADSVERIGRMLVPTEAELLRQSVHALVDRARHDFPLRS